MRRLLIMATVGGMLLAGFARAVPVRPAKKEIAYLDLQPQANVKLKGPFHQADNDLAELAKGEQKLGGVKFKIGDRLIHLAGQQQVFQQLPEKVEGIKVERKFAKLYILHAAGLGPQTKDDVVIGKYIVHYQDKSKATIEIVYGKDVRDWWYRANTPGVSRGKVAWKGHNALTRKSGAGIRLYLTTWKNPQPNKKVARIDFLSTRAAGAAPFCAAMTVEGK
jgi:hypothetical protein